MDARLINVIGFTAAALTTFSFVPQFLKLLKTRQTKGLSLLMMVQIAVGLVLWIVYGLLRKDIVLISANTIGFMIVLATITLYFRIKKEKDGV
ncbi:SemiSWEET family sugar transporter [Hippea alviniae]|uniref:SemiSWEET family sugar transporter n=1 Tax=Hippea alviniae TaxID=1279027 RepID=UPI0003B599F7|nr:SemiSWEET transporter [Hippea alviniae]